MFSQPYGHQQQPAHGGTNTPAFSPAGAAQAPTAPPPQAPGRRLRGSCDFCTRRKRKCDGDPALTQTRYGANRCSFCIAKNQPECHYSVRLLTGPRADSTGRRASKSRTEVGRGGSGNPNRISTNANGYGFPGKVSAGATQARDWDGNGGGGGGGGVLVSTAMAPLKRPRLSPSPATGLIGLRENVYIGDFFQTMGFLPFTSESFIRTAMVRTMFRTMQEQNPDVLSDGGDGDDGWGPENRGGALVPGFGGVGLSQGDTIESAAAACVLWSTVGVGCLIRGRPKSSVEGYAHLAREALSACFDDGTVETARAFTAMALLQNFMGNEERFNKYVDFAKSIVKSLPPEEVPADLLDTHLFMKACDMFCGASLPNIGPEDLAEAMGSMAEGDGSSCVKKDNTLIQQSDLCRWLLKTDIRLGACFSIDMLGEDVCRIDKKGDVHTTWGRRGSLSPQPKPESARSSGTGMVCGELCGNEDFQGAGMAAMGMVPPHVVHDDGKEKDGDVAGVQDGGPEWGTPAAAADCAASTCLALRNKLDQSAEPPPPGEMSRKFAAEVLPECQFMMRATNSPDVRDGVGELYFRSIMAYVFVLQGREAGAMEGLSRCVDIFLKSPGICRFSAWKHLAHCTLACMAMSRLPGRYELMRNAYNSVMDEPGERRAPPYGEWQGMPSVCDALFCRSLYSFFTAIPSRPRDRTCDETDEGDERSGATIAPAVSPSPSDENSPSSYPSAAAAAAAAANVRSSPPLNGSYLSSSSSSSDDSPSAQGVFDKMQTQNQPLQSAPAAAPAPTPASTPAMATATAESPMQVQAFFGNTSTTAPAATGMDMTAVAGFSGAFGGGVGAAQQVRAGADVGAPAAAAVGEGGPLLGSAVPHAVPLANFGNSSSGVGVSAEAFVSSATADATAVVTTATVAATTTAAGATAATAMVEEAGNNRVEREPQGLAGMDLLGELDGAEAGSLMDGVDLMLGEAILEGFGEAGGGGDDMLQFFEGNI
ncbi:unnamed protein product [Scytosiphon promiscuus]